MGLSDQSWQLHQGLLCMFHHLCYRSIMLIGFFKKLEKSKWLPWVGTAPFILIPLFVMFGGEVSRGTGILAFFASMWLGIFIGGRFAFIISTHVLKTSEDIRERLTAAFSVFGFLFIPVLVGLFANAHLGTHIEMHSTGVHLLWACVAAAICFCINPEQSENDS